MDDGEDFGLRYGQKKSQIRQINKRDKYTYNFAAYMIIEFGSCNRQVCIVSKQIVSDGSFFPTPGFAFFIKNLPQDHWNVLSEKYPEAFLWLGDAAYAKDNSVNAQKIALDQTKSSAAYASFLSTASLRSVFGVWDDHGIDSLDD